MMMLVVDASVAVKFLVREPGNAEARRLLALPDSLIAPDWILAEAASTFWKKVKRSELLVVHAERHLSDLPRFFETLYPSVDLVRDAFDWSIKLRHPIYDCIYLALAVRENCRLVTADVEFAEAVARGGLEDRLEAFA